MAAILRAIGVISGTSMDGIDVALVETDGEAALRTGPGRTYPYPEALRRALLALAADPARAEASPLAEEDEAVGDAHAAAVEAFLRDHAIDARDVALVGLHGQTILHRPERRFTRAPGPSGLASTRSTASATPTSRRAGRARRSPRSSTVRSPPRCRGR